MADKTVIRNVRVFDGTGLSAPADVVIEGDRIGTDAGGAHVVDGDGGILLPGLIDAHIHVNGRDSLDELARWGVTTGLDMASWPPAELAALRNLPGLTDLRSAGTPAIGPGGRLARIPGMAADAVLTDPEAFVATRLAEGSDYLKLVLEEGGPAPAQARALVEAAHRHGKLVVAHAVQPDTFELALDIGADVITHVPLGAALPDGIIARMAGTVAVPTLSMMESIAARAGQPGLLAGSSRSVGALHAAGIPVLAGTDANTAPGAPANVPHGESLHHELELLVAAGLSTVDALNAATSLPAKHFGLSDRGAVTPGWRADLVLIDGDPIADIRVTRNIRRVWCGGSER